MLAGMALPSPAADPGPCASRLSLGMAGLGPPAETRHRERPGAAAAPQMLIVSAGRDLPLVALGLCCASLSGAAVCFAERVASAMVREGRWTLGPYLGASRDSAARRLTLSSSFGNGAAATATRPLDCADLLREGGS